MFKIQLLNAIDPIGLKLFPVETYQTGNQIADADGILVRSTSMHDLPLAPSIKVIARAGAGVNNIPVSKLTQLGIPVLNTPGANANAVKELVIAGMLIASRNLHQAWDYVRNLSGDDAAINGQVEREKKRFSGFELPGKTLGVIGLGSIGVKVANSAVALGMRVIGYDPSITVQRAWELSAQVEASNQLDNLLRQADFISLHIPLNSETQQLMNDARFRLIKPGTILLNFAREGIVDTQAVINALKEKQLSAYVCDFPCSQLKDFPNVICLPHLGASTREAEENCAIMAVKQVREFLETGNIINSVNFPTIEMPLKKGLRLVIANANIPNMVAQISTLLAKENINIIDLLNKSRDEIAFTLIDVQGEVSAKLISAISDISGVKQVRCITQSGYGLQNLDIDNHSKVNV